MSGTNMEIWQPAVNSNWKPEEHKYENGVGNNFWVYSSDDRNKIIKYLNDNFQTSFIDKRKQFTPEAIGIAAKELGLNMGQPTSFNRTKEEQQYIKNYNAFDELAKIYNQDKEERYKVRYNTKTKQYEHEKMPDTQSVQSQSQDKPAENKTEQINYDDQPLSEFIKDYATNNSKTAKVLTSKLVKEGYTKEEAENYLKLNGINYSNNLKKEFEVQFSQNKPEENKPEENKPEENKAKELSKSVWQKAVKNPKGWRNDLTDEERNSFTEEELKKIEHDALSIIAASGTQKNDSEKISKQDKIENKPPKENIFKKIINKFFGQKYMSPEEKAEKDAKEKEKAEQQAERDDEAEKFLESHPSLVKSIFGKSGLTKGQRAMRIAELLSTIGANVFNGAYAGFKGQALPDPVKGRWAEYYDNAFKKQAEREQTVKDEENKAKIDIKKKQNYLKQNPTLQTLSDDTLKLLASNNNLNYEDFSTIVINDDSIRNIQDEDERKNIIENSYKAYKNSMSYNEDVNNQRKNTLEINGTILKNRKDFETLITSLQSQKNDLLKKKLENSSYSFEQAYKIIKSAVEPVKGIVSNAESLNEQTGFNWNVNASGGVGIKGIAKIDVNGGVGGNKGKYNSNSSNVDVVGLQALLDGKIDASNWQEQVKQIIEEYNKAIDEAVELVDKEIQELQNEKKNYIDDGIVKGKGIAQKIVRADGTEIHLNPNDNILATTKDLTSSNDNGDEIVPMEKEDKAYILQKRLGYADCPINKQFDYYLNKLRG